MIKALMGWNSFQDLWDLAIRRRGDPPKRSSLLIERAHKRLLVWELSRDEPLYGCGSFDLAMPEGFSFIPEELGFGSRLPEEGKEEDPPNGFGNLGPAVLRWVSLDGLDDKIRERAIVDTKIVIPAWPVFQDGRPAFEEAMLDQIHRDYWSETGTGHEFVWKSGDARASIHKMPLYQGGHWQVYLESWDFYRWLSEPKDPHQAPQRFLTKEEATSAALAARS